jgi:hypothetical protein
MNPIDSSAPVQGTEYHPNPAPAPKPIQLAELPETTFPGDPEAAVMALIAKFAQTSRDLSQALKKAAVSQRKAAQAKEVKALRDKADDIRSGGFLQAATLGASSALQAASFGSQMRAYQQAKLGDNAGTAAANATDPAARTSLSETSKTARESAQLSDLYAGGFSKAAETSGGLAKVFDRFDDATAAMHDSDATQAKHEGDNAMSEADEHGDDAKEAEELAQKAFDAIRAVFQAKHNAELAMLNRLA